MTTKSFRYTVLALNVLGRMLGSRFSVSGIENLPDNPVMFVANHFTRFETFFVPYLIYKHTGRQVRCLADGGLYHGILGRFLESVGTISTENPNRDKIIVSDLITGQYDWMIYPEGSMIKNKDIKKSELYTNNTPYRNGPVRTGSAVLALKSHLYRQDIIDSHAKKDQAFLDEMKQTFDVTYQDYLKNLETYVVPISITYYPIRPGSNRLELLVKRFLKQVPSRLAEELEIEGNLLSNAEMNLFFGKPIRLADYARSARELIYQIPVIKNGTKSNFLIKYFKHRLTTEFMGQIYSNLQVNFDHIFAAALQHVSENKIPICHLKRIIYLSALMIKKSGKYRIHESIEESNLFKMFIDEPHQAFDSAFNLALKLKEIEEVKGNEIIIHKHFLNKESDFHVVRIENTLKVIANEFALFEAANNIVRRNSKIPFETLRHRVFDELCKKDQDLYEADYQYYFDKEFSKDKSIGRPYFLDSSIKTSPKIKRVGILLCHGYKSSPKEVEALAKFLNGFGFKVYAVRLKGHGTSPINMKDISWQDWYDSLQRGHAILRMICSKIITIGFSTGGLLTLLSASQKNQGEMAVISINSALKLRDVRASIVRGVSFWNELLDKLHIYSAKFEYVDDISENPAYNYTRNYIKGVEELEKLMHICKENLHKIYIPSLIIQANEDPVIHPLSGIMIYEKISSKDKYLFEPEFKNHIIINGERKEEVFAIIKQFLHTLNLV